MLQLSAETRIGLDFKFHPDIAVANFGGDLRNFGWHRTKLRPWKTVEPHSCWLSRLDPAKRRIGGEFGRDNQPARRKDGGQPFAGLHNSACSQDRSFPNAPIDGCTDFPSFDLVVRAIHPHVQCIPLCLERCDLTMEPRYADISFTLAGELLLRNPARRAFHCRHNRTLSVQLRADLFHITLGCEPLELSRTQRLQREGLAPERDVEKVSAALSIVATTARCLSNSAPTFSTSRSGASPSR